MTIVIITLIMIIIMTLIVTLIMIFILTMNSSEEQVPGGFSGMQQNPALMQALFPFIHMIWEDRFSAVKSEALLSGGRQ